MKAWTRLFAVLLCSFAALTGRAQNQPVMTVSITEIAVLSNGNPAGGLAFIDVTNVGANYTIAPTVTISPSPTGDNALATATINLAGFVSNVVIDYPGSGYTAPPTITFSAPTSPPAGSLGVTAAAKGYVGQRFPHPTQNESFGSAGTAISITALAVGTFPAGGFTYEFFVDGVSIGTAVATPPAGTPASIGWQPPQPGSYFITVKASDGAHEATSLPVRYFAIGTRITSPTPNTIVPNGSSVSIQATATPQPLTGPDGNNAFVQRIEFYADDVLIGSDNTAPYSIIYTPSAPPTPNVPDTRHTIEARAFDNNGNQISPDGTSVQNLFMVPPIGVPPTVVLTSPTTGAKIAIPQAGESIPIAVSAGSPNGLISKVELYIDGLLFGTSSTFPYSFNWTPTVVGDYRLVALGYDDKNNVVATSSSAQGSLTPAPTLITIAAPPTITIVGPANGTTVGANTPIVVTAAADDSNIIGGGIAKVQFFAGSTFIGETETPAPGTNHYSLTFTPTAPGSTAITATAVNNLGLSTTSGGLTISVNSAGSGGGVPVGNPPVVAVSTPADGSVLRINTDTTLTATATDPDGTIGSVRFSVNNTPVGGAITTFPYRTTWKPTAEGVYRITATAVDNTGGSTTSPTTTVLVVASTTAADTVATGFIGAAGETGSFSAMNIGGKTAAFIGSSAASGAPKTYAFSGMPLKLNGSFTGTANGHTISGTFSDTGVFGTLDGNVAFSGPIAFPSTVGTVASGYYSGNLAGRLASVLNAIVGPDGSIALYVSDGTFQTAGFGSVDQSGEFDVSTNSGARIVGRADPVTRFLTGTLTGGPGGTLVAASSTGMSFSDGVMRNLSTRGQVGTGANVLTSGFVVGGSTPKQVLIRAVGPSLTAYGIASPLNDPQLMVLNSRAEVVATNDNWATPIGSNPADAAQIMAASASVGAFGLDSSSRDAVVLATLAPGLYTAQVSGGTGVALVELYDVDSPESFSSQKLVNVSTRGNVGTGQNQLIAGFVVSGKIAKNLLIRGVGPSLASLGVPSGFLADPVLRLVRTENNTSTTVRENDNWQVGNDAAQVIETAKQVGAFPLNANSKDAVILINLPPGLYTAELTGASTGIGLIEIYEVP